MADKNLNPSPKQVFMSSGDNISKHRKLLEDPAFERGVFFAKAQYIRRLHEIAPPNLDAPSFATAAAMCFERIQGMEDFIDVLFKLSESTPLPQRSKVSDNLEPLEPNPKN
jgi:hypothetical protein